MPWHALSPVHVMLHFEPLSQSMSLQAPSPTQLMLQVQPLEQWTLPQSSPLVHSTRQVCLSSSQLVQSAGHIGSTQ
jgi:hypothetical protein